MCTWINVNLLGFPGGSDRKIILLQCRRPGFDPWVGKIPWRRARWLTPIVLPGESPQTGEPGEYSSWSHRVGHDWETRHTHHTRKVYKMLWELKERCLTSRWKRDQEVSTGFQMRRGAEISLEPNRKGCYNLSKGWSTGPQRQGKFLRELETFDKRIL